ncbi:putative small GTPase superfamily, ARF/SAR type, P-loop containing nucleoside triphosphate hydrolase [Helianthus debilis subsp. tardiflorus]
MLLQVHYTLNTWDVGGQKTIRSYWRNYFEQPDGLVWVVVDSSDLRRLNDCKFEVDNLLKEEVLNLDDMDKSRHWRIVGCSGYTGEGLQEGFDWLVQDIASRIYLLD